MENLPRQELIDIVRNAALIRQNQQLDVLGNAVDCESELRNRCGGGYNHEIVTLIEAHRMNVIRGLNTAQDMEPQEIKEILFQLTDNLMNRLRELNIGDAYWAIDSWAEALNINAPDTRTFTCTWNVEIRGRVQNAAVANDWEQLLGTTPGSVTVPPDYHIRLIPQGMDNESFPIWVQHLELIEEIRYLDLREQTITDENLALLERFVSLEWLNLSSTEITDTGLLSIAKLNGLRHLYLDNCRWITNDGLRSLSKIRTLEGLSLAGNSKITNEGLRYLNNIPHLTELTFRGTGIQNAALSILEGMLFLQYLDVSYTDISDSALPALSVLPRLKELRLKGCSKITDAGIAHLQAVKPLRRLELSETGITDRGINYLRRCGLNELRILHCWGVTPRAIETIQRPGLRIILGGDRT